MRDEIIAMLPPEQRRRGGQKAPRVLVRRTDGRIEVDNLSEHARDWAAVAAAARIRTIMSALAVCITGAISRPGISIPLSSSSSSVVVDNSLVS